MHKRKVVPMTGQECKMQNSSAVMRGCFCVWGGGAPQPPPAPGPLKGEKGRRGEGKKGAKGERGVGWMVFERCKHVVRW